MIKLLILIYWYKHLILFGLLRVRRLKNLIFSNDYNPDYYPDDNSFGYCDPETTIHVRIWVGIKRFEQQRACKKR